MERTQEHAVADLIDSLASLRRPVHARRQDRQGVDLLLTSADGSEIAIEVTALSRVTPEDADRIVRQHHEANGIRLVVADQVTPAARDLLAGAGWGWLDRRGHLSLAAPAILIDTDVPPILETAGRPVTPALDTSVGLDVGVALLVSPDRRRSIRDLVDFTGRSLGAVHRAVNALTSEGLISRSSGLPLATELFWEAAGRWRPRRVALAGRPRALDAERTSQLDLGLEHIESSAGWAVADVAAANVFGALAPLPGDAPPDFYVPDDREVRVARSLYGDATRDVDRLATVAIPPVGWACRRRIDATALGRNHPLLEFGFVHPVVAALDLASDAGRGREILRDWTPPEPFIRVW